MASNRAYRAPPRYHENWMHLAATATVIEATVLLIVIVSLSGSVRVCLFVRMCAFTTCCSPPPSLPPADVVVVAAVAETAIK